MEFSQGILRRAQAVFSQCEHLGLTMGVAESCTGGLLGGTLTALSGSSKVFVGGIIAYNDGLKARLLGIDEKVLACGSASEELALALMRGASKVLQVHFVLAITGFAEASSVSSLPLVYCGGMLQKQSKLECVEGSATMSRHAVRMKAVEKALTLGYELLQEA